MSENLSTTTISFDATDIKKSTERPVYTPGWYRFRVTSGAKHVNTNRKSIGCGNFGVRQRVAAVDADGNTTVPDSLDHYLTFPRETPPNVLESAGLGEDFTQKKIPDTLGIIQGYLRTTRPNEFPTFPKKDEDNPGMFIFKGEVITAGDRQPVRDELLDNIGSFLAGLWDAPTTTDGDEFFGQLSYNLRQDDDGNVITAYSRVRSVRSELPEGVELVDTDDNRITLNALVEIMSTDVA